ncbi:hypothetical protein MMC29_008051 [Sticta canariensis]|nr:hypothetical protein [Sticta canariensis]
MATVVLQTASKFAEKMNSIITFSVFALGLTMLFLCIGTWYFFFWSEPKQTRFEDEAECQKIIGRQDCEAKLKSTWVKARAIPNQRLVTAFGIHNAFTTFDDGYRARFQKDAAQKLRLTDLWSWKHLANFARELLSKSLQTKLNRGEIPLVPLVQSLVLKIVISAMFDLNPFTLNDDTVSDLAHQINELWLESKLSPMNGARIRYLKSGLEENLGKIFPGQSLEPERTPMNLILPAYETMWRVVFRCFLEVAFRNPATAPTFRQALVRYLERSTAVQFEKASDKDPVSVSCIVSEALRLYPPTKRIFRKFPKKLGWGGETVVADIEACQRDSDIWGSQSLEFLPSRWIGLSKSARKSTKSFMPFGGDLFKCPAKEEFGPMMIGLLVAALVHGISKDNGWALNNDEIWDGQGPLPPLDSSREAYHSLSILRRRED